jgi:UDP-N-acetylmuramyl tripeptide synthase
VPVARLSPRSRVAVLGERLAARTSRVLRRGSGEMIGGKVALALAPGVLAELGAGRQLACVSGTNGKTTTTRLLAAALGARGPVVTNHGGANMTAGVVAALCRHRHTRLAALEVDEFYLPAVARALRPAVVVLLNISRDQLDRSNETRRIAGLWRSLGADLPGTLAVANADDPLVAWAAAGFARRVWVGAGQRWTLDARVCPACAALLDRADGGWSCPSCGLDRPEPSIEVSGPDALRVDGTAVPLRLNLPGRVNAANAAMALAAARELGVDPADALPPMSRVSEVSGRYSTRRLGGRPARLLLAKNPAGWQEMLDLLEAAPARPVVIAFNARVADGRDPSWIWDVPLDRLAGRQVLVCGERAADVGTRLAYAGVAHRLCPDPDSAAAAAEGGGQIDVIATYTAFRDLL